MKYNSTYDLLIIGGGISACVFASKYRQNNITKKVAIIDFGRGLGGRSSTRISRRFKGWKLNHGSPNLNICNSKNNLLLENYIDELLKNKFIKIDDSELVILNQESKLATNKNSEFFRGVNYLSLISMSKLSQNILESHNLMEKIDFYFETLIVELKFDNNEWKLTSQNGEEFKSKFLICTTNLLAHKRSLQILKINQIPLRKAIPRNMDKKIDLLLNFLDKQTFIPRMTFLIYTNKSYSYKDNYLKKYRYFCLEKKQENEFKFERVIFQLQDNNNLGIVVHSKSIDFINSYFESKDEDLFKQKISINFNKLFAANSSINQLTGDEKISIMNWRASQPSGHAVPLFLQFSEKCRVGFCGDWFAGEGFGRIEGSILSALTLVNKFKTMN